MFSYLYVRSHIFAYLFFIVFMYQWLYQTTNAHESVMNEACQCVELRPLQAAIAAAQAAEMEEFEYRKAVELLPMAEEKERVRHQLAQALGRNDP